MTTETLTDGIGYCERLAPEHPGVAALLAEVARLKNLCREYMDDAYVQARTIGDLRVEVARLQGEVAFDAALAPQDSAEIMRLRAENVRLRAALTEIGNVEKGGDAENPKHFQAMMFHRMRKQAREALGLTS